MGVKKIMRAWTERVLFKQVDPIGLAVFRMVFSVILACELFQLYTYRHIMYDRVPFGGIGEIDVRYIFLFWWLALVALFIGFKTRVATVLNYVLSVVIFSSASSFEYHIFYVYVGVGLVALFLPLGATCSVDDLLARVRWAGATDAPWRPARVFAATYLVPVLVGVGFVYFDSILYKFTSPMWLKGLGMWLPASLPMVIWNDASLVLDQKWLMLFLGYLVVIFETIFIFTFWYKRFRVPFLMLGMFFHLGILIIFPIPWFALATMALYLLMVPIGWWRCLFSTTDRNAANLEVYYDGSDPGARRLAAALAYFDPRGRVAFHSVKSNVALPQSLLAIGGLSNGMLAIGSGTAPQKGDLALGSVLNAMPLLRVPRLFIHWSALEKWAKSRIPGQERSPMTVPDFLVQRSASAAIELGARGWRGCIALLFACQFIVSLASPLTQGALESLFGPRIMGYIGWPDHVLGQPMVNFTGITHHPVFMDSHFQGYEHIMKVVHVDADGTREIVPLLDDNGMTSTYVRGAFWVNYTFRVSGAIVQLDHLERVSSYLDQYRFTHLNDPEAGHFEIFLKRIDIPLQWEEGFLREQMEKPWQKVGEYHASHEDGFSWGQQAIEIEANDR